MQDDVERVARAMCRLEYRRIARGKRLETVVAAGWPRYADNARAAMAATREIDAEALRAEFDPDTVATDGGEIADWLQQRANDVKDVGNG